jgi:hypothetical protein
MREMTHRINATRRLRGQSNASGSIVSEFVKLHVVLILQVIRNGGRRAPTDIDDVRRE